MTPKEKASDLVLKMHKVRSNSASMLTLHFAKLSALVAVDELIESHLVLTTTHDSTPSVRCKKYWQEVKKEIPNVSGK